MISAATSAGASLVPDGHALARIQLQRFAGQVQSVTAADSNGHAIPVALDGDVVTRSSR